MTLMITLIELISGETLAAKSFPITILAHCYTFHNIITIITILTVTIMLWSTLNPAHAILLFLAHRNILVTSI